MAFKGLFGLTDRLLHRALDGVAARQRVTAHNIANVDTPGYKRYKLDFESALRSALEKESSSELVGRVTHPRHIPIGKHSDALDRPFRAEPVDDTAMRNDGNNVDIESEMAQIIKDQVFYNVLAEQARRRYSMLRDAITEGRQ